MHRYKGKSCIDLFNKKKNTGIMLPSLFCFKWPAFNCYCTLLWLYSVVVYSTCLPNKQKLSDFDETPLWLHH